MNLIKSLIKNLDFCICKLTAPYSLWEISIFTSTIFTIIFEIYLLFQNSSIIMFVISLVCLLCGLFLGAANKIFYLFYFAPAAFKTFALAGMIPSVRSLGIDSNELNLAADMVIVTAIMPFIGGFLICGILLLSNYLTGDSKS